MFERVTYPAEFLAKEALFLPLRVLPFLQSILKISYSEDRHSDNKCSQRGNCARKNLTRKENLLLSRCEKSNSAQREEESALK